MKCSAFLTILSFSAGIPYSSARRLPTGTEKWVDYPKSQYAEIQDDIVHIVGPLGMTVDSIIEATCYVGPKMVPDVPTVVAFKDKEGQSCVIRYVTKVVSVLTGEIWRLLDGKPACFGDKKYEDKFKSLKRLNI